MGLRAESGGERRDGRGSWLSRIGSLLPRRRSAARPDGRVVGDWSEDARRTYPSHGLTPARAAGLLQAADAGQPGPQFELYEEMLQKWPRLAAVEATRRFALTGLEWEIVPDPSCAAAAGADDDARRAADHCRERLGRLSGLRGVLDHLATAIGFGVAAAELIWERGELVDVIPVPQARLTASFDEPWRLRVLTPDEPVAGVPLDDYPNKWIVHRPTCRPGPWFSGGLLRRSALLYLAQNLSFKDWLVFSQIAGMPVRVAKYEPGTAESDKKTLLAMLESLGTDAVAVVSKAVELQLIEPRAGERPYEPLQDHCNREVTILWLGQHLTTDIAQSGSRAAAEIHDRVREDLLVNDIFCEGETLRRDVLGPLTAAKFGPGVPPPQFRRSLVQSVDTKVLAETLAVAVRELGLEAPRAWVHRALGIPQAGPDEAVLRVGERS